ncbi:hypothetical protein HPB48_023104 [Haemaphysalis longicornis]|uniref:Uncharacterized protein n=1 Tax=Haemaphysalis longicornis TaxID=44386 RepID=A0A9J6GMR3_HAELO|nr:hypothetical protein HPB48_023104 [Haemaphysalis longicornis]
MPKEFYTRQTVRKLRFREGTMITHAYVRYEDDKRFAIVEVDDIKGFNPEDDFEGTFYNTKWTDDSGASDYYRSRILLVADSEARLKAKIAGRRVRVRRLPSSDSDSDDEIVEVDIGKGLLVPCGAWQRIQTREKDSLFVKDLLVTVWDPAADLAPASQTVPKNRP